MSADERLVLMLEARIAEFEKRMASAERRGTRTYGRLRRDSRDATRQMETDMRNAGAQIDRALANISGKIGMFGRAFAGGLVGASFGQFLGNARKAVSAMSEIGKEAHRVGMDAESFQGLRHGLGLAGVSASEASTAMETFVQRLGEAQAGAGPLADRLQAAGIALYDQNGEMRNTVDLLRDYSDLVRKAPDQAAKMKLVTDAFGKGGKAMVNALEGGAAGVDSMIEAARAAGVVLENDVIAKAEALDDKFAVLGQKIETAFKRGVVGAAEFLGLLREARAEVAFIQEDAARVIGEELARELGRAGEVSRVARAEIAGLIEEYRLLGQEAVDLVGPLSDASNTLRGIGQTDAAERLAQLVGEMNDAATAFERGQIEGEEFAQKLRDVAEETVRAIEELDALDRARLGGVIGQVQSLLGWIEKIPGAAADAKAAIEQLEGVSVPSYGYDAEDPLNLQWSDAPAPGARPRRAPSELGVDRPGRGGGGGRKGGGAGKGGLSGRLERVLSDLQTEREAVTAWYAESLELIQAASEAELAAIGGKHEALERLEAEHQERLRAIRDESQGGMLAQAEGFFGAMASVASAGGGRLQGIARAAAAAETMINAIRAQGQVLADPTLPFSAKIPAMLAIGKAGMSLVTALGGSGRGVPSPSAQANSARGGALGDQGPLLVRMEALDPSALLTGAMVSAMLDKLSKEAGARGLKFA